jgi:hypothetical protein
MVEDILVASTEEYGAYIGLRLAARGYKTIFYSPDPSISESVTKYRVDLYGFMSRERFIQIISEGVFQVAREHPESADVILICSDTLRGGKPAQNQTENLIRRLASSTQVGHSIIYSLICIPGTTSKIHQVFKKYAEEDVKDKVFGYAGLLHRENNIHPSYLHLNDDVTIELLTSSLGELFFAGQLEDAEALTISLLALEAVQNAVLSHIAAIHKVSPPSQLYRQIGPDTEDVLRYLRNRERLHGRLISYAERYLNNLFTLSCRKVTKKVRELSGKGIVNIMYIAVDEKFGEILSMFLPAKKCRVNVMTLDKVCDMLSRRDINREYDLIVIDPWYSSIAGVLDDVVDAEKIVILSGIHPSGMGV